MAQTRGEKRKKQFVVMEDKEKNVDSEQDVTKKKKKRRKGDPAYSNKKGTTSVPRKINRDALFNMRTTPTGIPQKEARKESKTAAVINEEQFNSSVNATPSSKKKIRAAIEKQFAKVKTHRPVEVKENEVVQTPGKTDLFHKGSYGFMNFYSSSPPIPRQQQDPLTINQNALKEVKSVQGNSKKQSILVTDKLLKKMAKKIRHASGRHISQNKVMATGKEKNASAGLHAKAAGFSNQVAKWEWLHLIAHFILGKKAQHEDNLVCGTYHSNTDMLFVETQFPAIAKAYPEGFEIDINAKLVDGTQVAQTIFYTIRTPHFSLEFSFDALKNHTPHFSTLEYIRAMVAVLLNPPVTTPTVSSTANKTDDPGDQKPSALSATQVLDRSTQLDPKKNDINSTREIVKAKRRHPLPSSRKLFSNPQDTKKEEPTQGALSSGKSVS